MSNKVVRDNIM